jgi:peptidoglycan hydrolase-like protein with peptidoglycan-binding domain
VAALVLTGGLGFWAGQQTFGSPVAPPGAVDSVVHEVVEASVGRSLSLNVTVEQPFVPVATNGLAGTVTSVSAGEVVDVGDVLYAVDTVPVRVVAGETPFWRDLSSGVDGADVAQLQEALADLGYYHGQVDGRFRWSTTAAVRAWQQALGVPQDGVVRLGEVVAVPGLPARLRLADEVVTGSRLAGGEQVVHAATGDIDFALVVSTGQAVLLPPDATVGVEHADHWWEAVLGESRTDDSGNVRFALSAPGGGPVCGQDCEALPVQERTTLRARVTVVPEVSGPAVPVAAVHTDPDGTAWVRSADGARREVTVLGSSGGVAVVDGLAVGDRVQVVGGGASNGDIDREPVDGDDGAGG